MQKSAKTSMSSNHVIKGVQTYFYFMKYSEMEKDPGLLWWLPCACCKWCPCGCGQNHLWSFIIVYPFNEWTQHKWHKVIIKWLLGFGIQQSQTVQYTWDEWYDGPYPHKPVMLVHLKTQELRPENSWLQVWTMYATRCSSKRRSRG